MVRQAYVEGTEKIAARGGEGGGEGRGGASHAAGDMLRENEEERFLKEDLEF